MSRKSLIVFICSFLVFSLALKGAFSLLKERELQHDEHEISLIHEAIKEEFQLTLTLPKFFAEGGARTFSQSEPKDANYSVHAPAIIKEHKEILGLNVLDANGVIYKILPEEANLTALGKKSQNFDELMSVFQKGQLFWMSPPFPLYQGQKGFAFYAAIVRNNKLHGWYAAVISTKAFFEKFRVADFLKTFELIIYDAQTKEAYFATAAKAPKSARTSKVVIEKREIEFISWRKHKFETINYPWYVCFLISLVLAGLITYLSYLRDQRNHSHRQVKDIRSLLQMTSKEALTSLIDVRTDKNIKQKELEYLSRLVEQIDLLQTMADPETTKKDLQYELLPLVLEQLEDLKDAIEKKNLRILFDHQNMGFLAVLVNSQLVRHGLIHHVLFHLVVYTAENSSIEITQKEKPSFYELIFHSHRITGPEAFRPDRRFEVARKVMSLCGGELVMENADTHGMIIKLVFPVKLKVDRSKEV